MSVKQNELTTIQVYRKDKEVLESRYGKPMQMAVRKALFVSDGGCLHPENQRDYTTAIVRAYEPGEPLAENEKQATLAGFYCRKCKRYVFPEPETK